MKTDTTPDDPNVQERIHEMLREAWSQHRDGERKRARKLYRRVLEIAPAHPDANNLLGLLWIQSGRPGDAVPLIERALDAQPDNAQSHFNLGLAHQDLGELARARDCFLRAAELQPDHVEAISSLANVDRLLGNIDEARQASQRVLQLDPDQVQAWCNLGFVENMLDNFEQAEKLFSEALSRNPRHRPALTGYGEALMGQHRFVDAEQWLRKALKENPGSPDMHNDLGATLNRLDHAEGAVEQFVEALRLDPMHAQARMNLGLTLEQLGYLDDAERAYRDTIRSAPSFVDAHFHLAHLHTHQSTDEEIAAMQKLLAAPALPDPVKARLAFGLGHALESAGEREAAFQSMQMAHEIRSRTNPFNMESAVQSFSTLRTYFTSRRIAKLQEGGVPDERPVLVIGMPRSGTSLVEQILASHPLVHGAGETGLLGMAAAQLSRRLEQTYPEGLDALPDHVIREQAQQYLAGLEKRAGSAQRIVDTTPMNYLQLGLAAALLPDARFVHCRRDPMDNCLSIYRQMLGDAHSYAHDLHDLGHFYQMYEQLMEHWQEILPGRIHEVSYERLVQDPRGEIRQLLEFCGIPNSPACLEFQQTQRLVRTAAASQVRQPLYDSSIGAWKLYATQLEPLRQILRPGD